MGDIILNPAGNVGIGTTSPGAKLEVNGDIRHDGYIQGPTGRKMIVVDTYSAGAGNPGTATDHSVYVNGEVVSTSGRDVHLTVLSGSDGSVIHSDTYDTHADGVGGGAECTRLANDINSHDTNGNTLIINTYDQPQYMNADLQTALREVMKSTRIVQEGVAYRGAFAITYQNGRGKLAEDVSNTMGGTTQYGDSIEANAAIHFVTYVD